jgi:hypothetical protein
MGTGERDSRMPVLPLVPGRTPVRKDHILTRNKYPDIVLNCAVFSVPEACLLFISTTCFLCDSQKVTCITLHFFTHCYEMFTSDTRNGLTKELLLPVPLPGKPHTVW